MAVTRLHGLHPAADIVLRHGGFCQDQPSTLVLAPLSTLPSAEPSTHPRFTHHPIPDSSGGPSATPSVTAQPILHLMDRAHHSRSFPPNILRHHRARAHSKISNRNPEHIPELGSIQIFQPSTLPLPRAQIRLKISEETPIPCPEFLSVLIYEHWPIYIAESGSISEFPTETQSA